MRFLILFLFRFIGVSRFTIRLANVFRLLFCLRLVKVAIVICLVFCAGGCLMVICLAFHDCELPFLRFATVNHLSLWLVVCFWPCDSDPSDSSCALRSSGLLVGWLVIFTCFLCSLLVGLSIVFCPAKLTRWAGLIAFWLTIAFLCDCDASTILGSLDPFAKLFTSFVFLVMVVARQILLSCSNETSLVLLTILTRSLLILLNVFFIFLLMVVDSPFAVLVRVAILVCLSFIPFRCWNQWPLCPRSLGQKAN